MADTIKVTMAPTTLEARPNAPIQLVLSILNVGTTVDHYGLEIDGLPSSWYTLPEERKIALFPNDREEARITILPSKEAEMPAGTHPFTVTVVSRAHPDQRADVQGTIRVPVASALDAQLRPSRASGRKARYSVLLRNGGNAALDVDLEAFDSEEGCDFTFKPDRAHLEPGRKATVTMLARPLRTRLAGPQQSFDFRVTAQPSAGEARPIQGLFIYKPRFRSWAPFVRLVTLVLLVLAAVVAAPFVLPQLRKAAQQALVPNAAIGNVPLGAKNPNVVMAKMSDKATMTNHDTLITDPQKVGTLQAHLRQGQVVAMETNSPSFTMTTGNIHVGSSAADLQKTLGKTLVPVGAGSTGTASAASGMGGKTLVVVGKNTMDGGHAMTYFDVNKAGKVQSIRMGYYPYITADHGGPTRVAALTTSTTWGLQGGPYLVSGDVRIPKGVTLTVQPGVHVFFADRRSSLLVDGGALNAVGTAAAPIVFTSIDDIAHGAYDTLKRPAPAPGDWGSLGITAAGGTFQLDHAQVYYGGASAQGANAEVAVAGGSAVSIRNSEIAAAQGFGLDAGGAPPGAVIAGNSFAGNTYPLRIGGAQSLDAGNQFAPRGDPPNAHTAIYLQPGVPIAANGATVSWSQPGVPFILPGDATVASGGTLQLNVDVILKGLDANSGLTVDGTLVVAGTPNHSVIMTSYRDDAHGGDSNGDGTASAPRPGDWRGLVIAGAGRAVVHRLIVLYGGANGGADLAITGHARVDINRAEFAGSAGAGIANSSDGAVRITRTALHDNAGYGIDFGPGAQRLTTLGGITFANDAGGTIGAGNAAPAAPVAGASPTPPPPTPATGTPSPVPTSTPVQVNTAVPTNTAVPSANDQAPTATNTPTSHHAHATATPTSSANDRTAATPTAIPTVTATIVPSATSTPTATATPTETPAGSANDTSGGSANDTTGGGSTGKTAHHQATATPTPNANDTAGSAGNGNAGGSANDTTAPATSTPTGSANDSGGAQGNGGSANDTTAPATATP